MDAASLFLSIMGIILCLLYLFWYRASKSVVKQKPQPPFRVRSRKERELEAMADWEKQLARETGEAIAASLYTSYLRQTQDETKMLLERSILAPGVINDDNKETRYVGSTYARVPARLPGVGETGPLPASYYIRHAGTKKGSTPSSRDSRR